MMRTRILSIVIIAFLMLLIPVNVASAKYSITLGHVSNNSTEYYLHLSLVSLIITASSYREYNTQNWYGSQTTYNHVLLAATGLQEDDSIVFYIGHGDKGFYHYYITTYDLRKVHDYVIYGYTSSQNLKFVFLWSCHQGDIIGSGEGYFEHGMPRAWLHTSQLSSDGYHDPWGNYVFIGFYGAAPLLSSRDPQFTQGSTAFYPLYSFATEFYSAALAYYTYGRDIRNSLKFASYRVWGTYYFDDTVLWQGYTIDGEFGRMVVYGNSLITIY